MNVRRSSGRGNFKQHDVILTFCNLESCIIACHLHLSCTQLLNLYIYILVFDSQDRNKALHMQRKAKIGQKKLALNKTNKSPLSCVNIFCSTAGTVPIPTADILVMTIN